MRDSPQDAADRPVPPDELGRRTEHDFFEIAARIGPSSRAFIGSTEQLQRCLDRCCAGTTCANVVLAEVHRAARGDPKLAEEFIAYFLNDIMQLGHGVLGARQRHLLDSGDLVQSVLGDLWPVMAELEFRSRAQFLSLVAQRIRWKAANRVRGLRSARRREDLRFPLPEDGIACQPGGPGPATQVGALEEHSRAQRLLRGLPQAEYQILSLHLDGMKLDQIAQTLAMTAADARRDLRRAIRHARESLGT